MDPVRELYENRSYPSMSHPTADPAVTAVAARIGGLQTPHPRGARILEIGCASGHHLIPLALRWPESRLTGVDLSAGAIACARSRAAAAGCGNLDFQAVDLREFLPEDGPFDFIIAHGFFSWVPDSVKAELLKFCHRNLSPSGVATISFNVEAGWRARFPVIAKVRAIQQARGGDEISALEILRGITEPGNLEFPVIEDMLAKGAEILPFDDFSPVNDPWPLDRFVQTAMDSGLRWLGESDPGKNLPASLSASRIRELMGQARGALDFQLLLDEASQRTFRSGLLCRQDAILCGKSPLQMVTEFAVRMGRDREDFSGSGIVQTLRSFAPNCVAVEDLMKAMPGREVESLAREILDGISRGWILPRIEPVKLERQAPEFPKLDEFRMRCALEKLPLVDVWHVPCGFPESHEAVLVKMDGSRSRHELAAFAKENCPDLAFEPWLDHLASRGMFS